METKHTPGPWKVLREKQVDDDCKHEGEIVVDVVADVHRHLICYTPISGNKDAHANANLIAAAPELLEALERMVRTFVDLRADTDWSGHGEDALNEARAAIAKATP